MKIGELMTPNPVSLKESDYMTRARQLFRDGHWRVIPVINNDNDNRVLGVLTEREILSITSTKSNVTVAGFITHCMTAPMDMEIHDAAAAMCRTKDDHIIVTPSSTDLTLLGVVSVVDLFSEVRPNRTLEVVVGDVMTHVVDSCKPTDALSTLWHRLIERDYTGMPVVDDEGRALGMITRYDLIKAGCLRHGVDDVGMSRTPSATPRSMNTPLSRLMNTPLYTIDSQTPVLVAIDEFIKKGVGRLTVVDEEDRLIGIVDRYDLLTACVQ